ncbi:hypothetical protein, partial [Sphingomonas sp.]|uniref:hypothetical protein n=1 Tax=Sphingomonas sp. TaxID=28214 RepID=UPI0035A8505C
MGPNPERETARPRASRRGTGLRILAGTLAALPVLLNASLANAAAPGVTTINGADLNLLWGLPFAGMLLSIALF